MRSEIEVNNAIKLYSDTMRRICILHLKSYHDAEDICQTVFIKYMCSDIEFESAEHEKAWIIRVTINACKDLLKSFFRSRTVNLNELICESDSVSSQSSEVLEAFLSLPPKYKNVIHLHYYEGYTAPEIAEILGKNVNTVYTLLTRAKKLLKETLGGEELA